MSYLRRGQLKKVNQWKVPGTNTFTPWHEDDSSETLVELIPYDCSRLRISEYPTI